MSTKELGGGGVAPDDRLRGEARETSGVTSALLLNYL
jgi:hypothetical protein